MMKGAENGIWENDVRRTTLLRHPTLKRLRLLNLMLSKPDPSIICELYTNLSKLSLEFVTTNFRVLEGKLLVEQNGETIEFPDSTPLLIYSHVLAGYKAWLGNKYTSPGFIDVEEGDVVIDCGSFVGGFSIYALDKGATVFAFEPSEINFECVQTNLARRGGVAVRQGLYNATKVIDFNISQNPVENSLIETDDETVSTAHQINVTTLSDYFDTNKLTKIDFLKVEAEGVEPEVIDGLGDLRPRKIAVDVSPERGGKSPAPEITATLRNLGYETQQVDHVLYARIAR